jgi:hypothetical protein
MGTTSAIQHHNLSAAVNASTNDDFPGGPGVSVPASMLKSGKTSSEIDTQSSYCLSLSQQGQEKDGLLEAP